MTASMTTSTTGKSSALIDSSSSRLQSIDLSVLIEYREEKSMAEWRKLWKNGLNRWQRWLANRQKSLYAPLHWFDQTIVSQHVVLLQTCKFDLKETRHERRKLRLQRTRIPKDTASDKLVEALETKLNAQHTLIAQWRISEERALPDIEGIRSRDDETSR
mgnify:CR=1 FL=1